MTLPAFKTLSYQTEGDVATITLLNSFSDMTMIKELTKVCDHLEDSNPCSVVVLRGSEGRFNLGINFSDFRSDAPMDIHGFNKWERICTRIERLPKVSISVLEGGVIGGGFQLSLVTDVRIAAPQAYFQLPELKQGFLPGMAVFRMAKYIGLGRAKRLILQCVRLSAQEAQDLGLVDVVSEDLDVALRQSIASFRPIHPVSIQLARRLLNESFHDSFEDAIGHFLAAQHRSVLQSAFLNTLRQAKDSDDDTI